VLDLVHPCIDARRLRRFDGQFSGEAPPDGSVLRLDDVQQSDRMPVTKLILNDNGYAFMSYLLSKVSLYH
jgi:hypothetical protein